MEETPSSVLREQFLSKVIDAINTSGLPMWVVHLLLKDVQQVVEEKAAVEYKLESERYSAMKEGE